MTSHNDAIKAARIYRDTQPAIDALRDTMRANEAAKKILGPYMSAKQLPVFRGVELKCVTIEVLDGEKVSILLGDQLSKYRKRIIRNYFRLAKRKAVTRRR